VPFTRVNYSGRPIYQLGISFFKIALLFSYLRLFEGTNQRVYRLVVRGAIILIFLSHLGCAFALMFACTPVRSVSTRQYPGLRRSCYMPLPALPASRRSSMSHPADR
jgi:hypothetical protein